MTTIETPATTTEHEVVVVGAGFSGIAAVIKLREQGIEDVVVLEEGHGVGGTWYWNRYPGIAVDIPSFSYQYSFAPRTDWSRVYAPGEELRGYADSVVDRFGVREHIRFGTRVTGARFDDAADRWHLETAGGEEVVGRHVVLATGGLSHPKPVDIPGVESFRGETVHTARWDPDVDLRGKRVAVIGTGASAVQLIAEIAPEVGHLTVFQRTPIWCLPKPDGPIGGRVRSALERSSTLERAARVLSHSLVELQFPLALHYSKAVPTAAAAEKLGRWWLKRCVPDPELRDKLTPRYPLGCKRPAFHNGYLQTYNRPNVTLETTGIERITETGVRTTDGTEHEVDVLITATGFQIFASGSMPPFPVAGADGRDLDAHWQEHRFRSYQGVAVPGFPNFHLVFGPYGYNLSSYFTLVETQIRHIGRVLGEARRRRATRVEVKREAEERFRAEQLRRRGQQLLVRANCSQANSYYFDRAGDSPFRVGPTPEMHWRSRRFPLDDYRFSGPARGAGTAAPAGAAQGSAGR